MSIRLDGKTALITGASSGLGVRFARILAEAGAKVAIAARRTDRLAELARAIEEAGGRALPLGCDVTDASAVRLAIEEAETELGPIGILINNSGVTISKRIVDCDEADYDRVLDTNLKGAFLVAQEVGRRMIHHGLEGRIVNIASSLGLRPLSGLALYAASKAALIHLTKSMALEWARFGINANAICPGYIETEMNEDYWRTEGGRKLLALLPRKRVGEPRDLDGILLLLASGEEGRFINGAIIAVDEGLYLG